MPRRHSSKIRPRKPGRKQTKSTRAVGIEESNKGKTKSRSQYGSATRKGGKQDKNILAQRGKPPLIWMALCHPKEKRKRDMLSLRSKRERNRKWVFSPNRRLLELCPCPRIDEWAHSPAPEQGPIDRKLPSVWRRINSRCRHFIHVDVILFCWSSL